MGLVYTSTEGTEALSGTQSPRRCSGQKSSLMDKGKVLNGFNTEVKTDLSPHFFLSFSMTVSYFCLW